MKPTLVTLEDWPLWPERTPCDVDFVDWAEESKAQGQTILHMGTGTHHLVGRTLAPTNYVLGITCCPAEMESYMSWAVENPELSTGYQCLFGDLYVLSPRLLPKFHVITLFHLSERPDPRRETYGALTPTETARVLTTIALANNGWIVSYTGSATAREAEIALTEAGLEPVSNYKSLRFWKPTW